VLPQAQTYKILIGWLAASGVADGYTTTACFLIFEGACGLNFAL
jgi:hypothetical protein